jgi:hypothetical protein
MGACLPRAQGIKGGDIGEQSEHLRLEARNLGLRTEARRTHLETTARVGGLMVISG